MINFKVYLSPLADFKLEILLGYIETNWGLASKNKFLALLKNNIKNISAVPEGCERSKDFEGLYKCVVAKQTSIFYRINEDSIEIVTIIDNRQNPDEISEEIKKHFG